MRWIRKRVALIAGVVVGGFLLWLATEAALLQTTGSQAAGTLFGRPVPLGADRKALEAVLHQAIFTHGDRYRQQVTQKELEEQAWERLIFLAEARRKSIRVPDKEVIQELQGWPIFLDAGKFNSKTYEAIIRYSLGTAPRNFEEEVRETMMIRKLVQQALEGAAVTEEDLQQAFREKEEAIQISYLALDHPELALEIAQAARQDPGQLDRLAKQVKQKVIRSDFFKRAAQIPELGIAGTTLGDAFLLEPNQVGGPYPTPKGWLVLKLQAKQPADPEKFPQMKESLENEVMARKRLTRYLTWYQDLLKRANPKKALIPGTQ